MLKKAAAMIGAALLAGSAMPASGAVLGEYAEACEAGRGPAMLVHITGLKTRTGMLRVQSYGGAPRSYFEKGAWQRRIEVRVPATGPVDVCVPVAANGTYAVSVRHDLNGSGKTDMKDGGGMSGNPHLSLWDVMLKRKPEPQEVQVSVRGVTRVPVTLNYVQGGTFKPVALAAR
ncbi:DUF2141 domain-containing protein [Sphingomonas sp. ID0503]|uniref:DUF2141 domain-containing protein n=1 Tax=Sphingomonas sp. ID0503 TaxID=3399691 RepID=UPI003AFB614C